MVAKVYNCLQTGIRSRQVAKTFCVLPIAFAAPISHNKLAYLCVRSQMQDFLEHHYLQEQVDSIRQLAGYVSQLTALNVTNPGLGEHIFDEKLKK